MSTIAPSYLQTKCTRVQFSRVEIDSDRRQRRRLRHRFENVFRFVFIWFFLFGEWKRTKQNTEPKWFDGFPFNGFTRVNLPLIPRPMLSFITFYYIQNNNLMYSLEVGIRNRTSWLGSSATDFYRVSFDSVSSVGDIDSHNFVPDPISWLGPPDAENG